MENFKIIVKKEIDNIKRVGIVSAKDWYNGAKYGYPVHDDDFVVCSWSDFHDGVNSHIEGKETIAICRSIEDAYLLFKSK
jgi:hypothetical protein